MKQNLLLVLLGALIGTLLVLLKQQRTPERPSEDLEARESVKALQTEWKNEEKHYKRHRDLWWETVYDIVQPGMTEDEAQQAAGIITVYSWTQNHFNDEQNQLRS